MWFDKPQCLGASGFKLFTYSSLCAWMLNRRTYSNVTMKKVHISPWFWASRQPEEAVSGALLFPQTLQHWFSHDGHKTAVTHCQPENEGSVLTEYTGDERCWVSWGVTFKYLFKTLPLYPVWNTEEDALQNVWAALFHIMWFISSVVWESCCSLKILSSTTNHIVNWKLKIACLLLSFCITDTLFSHLIL